MRAIVCSGFDGPDALSIADAPSPRAGSGRVVVDVHMSAVTHMDVLLASGRYQMRPELPFVPGTDGAGIVAEVGEGVTRFAPGDRVACSGWFGSWAERMSCDQNWVVKLPEAIDFATGSAIRHGYGTAWYALIERARTRPGETVLVTGAAGGVGLAAVDLARDLGARVIAVVGSAAKADLVRAYGAHDVIDRGTESLKERVKALTGGRGVDVCLDNIGGETFDTMTRLMAWNGRLMPVGFTSGTVPSVPMNLPLLKNYSIVGVFWGAWAERFPAESVAADDAVMRLVADGRLRPHVDEVVPLDAYRDAIARVQARETLGRVVLAVR